MTNMLTTKRLNLRHWQIEDEEQLWPIFSNKSVMDPLGGIAVTEVERHRFLAYVVEMSKKPEHLVVECALTQRVIGFIGYSHCSIDETVPREFQFEFGYGINQDYWGQGYGTEMVMAVRDYLMIKCVAQTIWLKVFDFNPASEVIIKKCGFLYQFSIEKVLKHLDDREVLHRHYRLDVPEEHLKGYERIEEYDALTPSLELVLNERRFSNPEKNYVTTYVYDICFKGATIEKIGCIDLRVGHNQNTYYGGNIGYEIFPAYRGHSYAARACRLLKSLALAHKMDRLVITCNPDNWASRRTIEKVGLRFDGIVKLPPDNDMVAEGEFEKCIYTWNINELAIEERTMYDAMV